MKTFLLLTLVSSVCLAEIAVITPNESSYVVNAPIGISVSIAKSEVPQGADIVLYGHLNSSPVDIQFEAGLDEWKTQPVFEKQAGSYVFDLQVFKRNHAQGLEVETLLSNARARQKAMMLELKTATNQTMIKELQEQIEAEQSQIDGLEVELRSMLVLIENDQLPITVTNSKD